MLTRSARCKASAADLCDRSAGSKPLLGVAPRRAALSLWHRPWPDPWASGLAPPASIHPSPARVAHRPNVD